MSNLYHHCNPFRLLTLLHVTQNQKAMSKGAKITHVTTSNAQQHSEDLRMLKHFLNSPVETIASAFVVVVPRLFLVSRLKNAPREKVVMG